MIYQDIAKDPSKYAIALRTSVKEPTATTFYSPEGLDPVEKSLYGNPDLRTGPANLYGGVVNIGFGLSSDIISDEDKVLLNNYARFGAQLDGVQISLEGFASVEGSSESNKALSNRRVQNVKNYLTTKILESNPNADITKIIVESAPKGETTSQGSTLEANRVVTIEFKFPAKPFTSTPAQNEIPNE